MKVHLPSHLDHYTSGLREIDLPGATLAEVLDALDERYPGIRFRLINEQDGIRRHIRLCVAGEVVRTIDHPVAPGEEIHIIAALSGG